MIQRNNIIAHKAIRPLSAKGWIFQLRKRWPSPSKCFFRKFSIIGVESWQKIFSDVETAICRWENEHQTAFCLRKMKIWLTLSLNHCGFKSFSNNSKWSELTFKNLAIQPPVSQNRYLGWQLSHHGFPLINCWNAKVSSK